MFSDATPLAPVGSPSTYRQGAQEAASRSRGRRLRGAEPDNPFRLVPSGQSVFHTGSIRRVLVVSANLQYKKKMDPMNQSAQISSSQGLADGQTSAAKDSKVSGKNGVTVRVYIDRVLSSIRLSLCGRSAHLHFNPFSSLCDEHASRRVSPPRHVKVVRVVLFNFRFGTCRLLLVLLC